MKKQKYFRLILILFFSIVLPFSSHAQKFGISIGPTISPGEKSFFHHGKKGLGASIEIYYKLFPHGGLRFYFGYDKFKTPNMIGDKTENIPIRAGYQHFLTKNRVIIWGDAGIGSLIYPYYGTYTGFSFSIGGGYNFWFKKRNYLQFQGMYSFTSDTDPFYPKSPYGWYTFRIAYGIGNNRK